MEYHAVKLTDMQAELLRDRLFDLTLRSQEELGDLGYDPDHIEKVLDRCPEFAGTFYVYQEDLEMLADEVENLRELNDDPWEVQRPGAVRSLENLQVKLLKL